MGQSQLVVKSRTHNGTREVRRMRADGFIPGVIYGKSVEPTPVMVSRHDFIKMMHERATERGFLSLKVEGDGKNWETPVLMKNIQRDPVSGSVVHIDFQAIKLTEKVRIKVSIVLKGEPIGVKRDSGVLEHFLREVEVECLPTAIPDKMEYDISELAIGDAIHVKDLAVPSGVELVTEVEAVIASVLAHKEEKPEELVEAVTEPEVIREKKPEEEEEAKAGESSKEEKKEKEDKKEK